MSGSRARGYGLLTEGIKKKCSVISIGLQRSLNLKWFIVANE